MTENKARINAQQAEILVRYMEEYPKLASGGKSKDIIEPSTELKRQALWQMLADELNSCGVRKNASRWKKTWADMKRGIKEKVKQVQGLTPFEERVYVLSLPEEERANFQRQHSSTVFFRATEFLLPDDDSLKQTSSENPDNYSFPFPAHDEASCSSAATEISDKSYYSSSEDTYVLPDKQPAEVQVLSNEPLPPLKKLLPKIAPAPPNVGATNVINLPPDTFITVNSEPKKPQTLAQVNSVVIIPKDKSLKKTFLNKRVRMSIMKSRTNVVKKRISISPYAGALVRVKREALKARKEHAAAQIEMAEAQKELAAAYREVAAAQQELAESQNNLRCSFDKLTQVALKIAQRFV